MSTDARSSIDEEGSSTSISSSIEAPSDHELQNIRATQQRPQTYNLALVREKKSTGHRSLANTPVSDDEDDDEQRMQPDESDVDGNDDEDACIFLTQVAAPEPEECMTEDELVAWHNRNSYRETCVELLMSGMSISDESDESKRARLLEAAAAANFDRVTADMPLEQLQTTVKREIQDTEEAQSAMMAKARKAKTTQPSDESMEADDVTPMMTIPMTINEQAAQDEHTRALEMKIEQVSPLKQGEARRVLEGGVPSSKSVKRKIMLPAAQTSKLPSLTPVEQMDESAPYVVEPPQTQVPRKETKRKTLPSWYKGTELETEANGDLTDLEDDQVDIENYVYEMRVQSYYPRKDLFAVHGEVSADREPTPGEKGYEADRQWNEEAHCYAPPSRALNVHENDGPRVLAPNIGGLAMSITDAKLTKAFNQCCWDPKTDKPVVANDWTEAVGDPINLTGPAIPRGHPADSHDNVMKNFKAFDHQFERFNTGYMAMIATVMNDGPSDREGAHPAVRMWCRYGMAQHLSRQVAVLALVGKNFKMLEYRMSCNAAELPIKSNKHITESTMRLAMIISETCRFELNNFFFEQKPADNWQRDIDQLTSKEVPPPKMVTCLIHNLLAARVPGEADYTESNFMPPLETTIPSDVEVLAMYTLDKEAFQRLMLLTAQLAMALSCCLVSVLRQDRDDLLFWSPLLLRYRLEMFGLIVDIRTKHRLSSVVNQVPPLVKKRVLPKIDIEKLTTKPFELLSNRAVEIIMYDAQPSAGETRYPASDPVNVACKKFYGNRLPMSKHLLWRAVPSAVRPAFIGEDAQWRENDDLKHYREKVLSKQGDRRTAVAVTQIIPHRANSTMPLEPMSEQETEECKRLHSIEKFWQKTIDELLKEVQPPPEDANVTLAGRSRIDMSMTQAAWEALEHNDGDKPLTELTFKEIMARTGPLTLADSNYKDGCFVDFSEPDEPLNPLQRVRRKTIELNAEKNSAYRHIKGNQRIGLGVSRSPRTIPDMQLRVKYGIGLSVMADVDPPARRMIPEFKDPLHGLKYERAHVLTREIPRVHFLRIRGMVFTSAPEEARLVVYEQDYQNFKEALRRYDEKATMLKHLYDRLYSFFPEDSDKSWEKLAKKVKEEIERMALYAHMLRYMIRVAMINAAGKDVDNMKKGKEYWLTCSDDWYQCNALGERTTARLMLHHPWPQGAHTRTGRPADPSPIPCDMDGNPVEMRNAGTYVSLHPDVYYNLSSPEVVDPISYMAGERGSIMPDNPLPIFPLSTARPFTCIGCAADMRLTIAHKTICPLVQRMYANGSYRTFIEVTHQYAEMRFDVHRSHVRLHTEMLRAEDYAAKKAKDKEEKKTLKARLRRKVCDKHRLYASWEANRILNDVAKYGSEHSVFRNMQELGDFSIIEAAYERFDTMERKKLRVPPGKGWTMSWYHKHFDEMQMACWQIDWDAYAPSYSEEAEQRRKERFNRALVCKRRDEKLGRFHDYLSMMRTTGYTKLLVAASSKDVDVEAEIDKSEKQTQAIFASLLGSPDEQLEARRTLEDEMEKLRTSTQKDWARGVQQLHAAVVAVADHLQKQATEARVKGDPAYKPKEDAVWPDLNMRDLLENLVLDHDLELSFVIAVWRKMFWQMRTTNEANAHVDRVAKGIEIPIDDGVKTGWTKDVLKWLMQHFVRSKEEKEELKNAPYALPACFCGEWHTWRQQTEDGNDALNFCFEDPREATRLRLTAPTMPRIPHTAADLEHTYQMAPPRSVMQRPGVDQQPKQKRRSKDESWASASKRKRSDKSPRPKAAMEPGKLKYRRQRDEQMEEDVIELGANANQEAMDTTPARKHSADASIQTGKSVSPPNPEFRKHVTELTTYIASKSAPRQQFAGQGEADNEEEPPLENMADNRREHHHERRQEHQHEQRQEHRMSSSHSRVERPAGGGQRHAPATQTRGTEPRGTEQRGIPLTRAALPPGDLRKYMSPERDAPRERSSDRGRPTYDRHHGAREDRPSDRRSGSRDSRNRSPRGDRPSTSAAYDRPSTSAAVSPHFPAPHDAAYIQNEARMGRWPGGMTFGENMTDSQRRVLREENRRRYYDSTRYDDRSRSRERRH